MFKLSLIMHITEFQIEWSNYDWFYVKFNILIGVKWSYLKYL